eukprot:3379714-Rhodomonas_salina.1
MTVVGQILARAPAAFPLPVSETTANESIHGSSWMTHRDIRSCHMVCKHGSDSKLADTRMSGGAGFAGSGVKGKRVWCWGPRLRCGVRWLRGGRGV